MQFVVFGKFTSAYLFQIAREKSFDYLLILAYLKDSNAAAHFVDTDVFHSSDSSICALQDLT